MVLFDHRVGCFRNNLQLAANQSIVQCQNKPTDKSVPQWNLTVFAMAGLLTASNSEFAVLNVFCVGLHLLNLPSPAATVEALFLLENEAN